MCVPKFDIVSSAANEAQLSINMDEIRKIGTQPSGSCTCACYALAYCRTIIDGYAHSYSEYNMGGTEQYDWDMVSCEWWRGQYDPAETSSSEQVLLEKIVNYIDTGIPVVVFLSYTQKNGEIGQHWVAVVGYTNISDYDHLSLDNFLMLDPAKTATLDGVLNIGQNGYWLRKENNRYIFHYTSDVAPLDNADVKFHNESVSNITDNDATISTWTSNNNGEIFSTGFWIGTSKESMQLFTTHSHISWTEFHGEYQVADYYGRLSPGTKYYYRWYLISADGMKYYESAVKSFVTTGKLSITFDSFESVSESSDTAELSVWTRNHDGYQISSYGIYIGESIESMEKKEIGQNVAWTDFYTSVNVIDIYKQLSPEKQYYYKWYVEADTAYYSEVRSFITNVDVYPPLIQSISTENVSSKAFTLVSKITDNIGVTKVEFEVWKDGSPDRKTVNANYSHDDFYCYRFAIIDFTNETGVYHAIVKAYDNRNEIEKEYDIIVPDHDETSTETTMTTTVSTVISTTTTATSTTSDITTTIPITSLKGDYNGDKDVTIADAVILIRFLTEDITLTDAQVKLIMSDDPDFDGDGFITIIDVIRLLIHINALLE